MYKRDMSSELSSLATQYPIVTVIGPRQSGKTTLVRRAFPDKKYVNLEAPDAQEMAKEDPRSFLEKYPDGAIFDEVQKVPSLLSYIQVIVDETPKKGMFILIGSHQLELHQAISQSLAGRTAILSLLPLSLAELSEAHIEISLDEVLIKGGYPGIYNDQLSPMKAYRSYFQTYIERDVRQLAYIKDLTAFQRFMRILAGRVGQILNCDGIAGDVGVSSKTIKDWLSVLEASFIIIRLQPYFENFGKRIIKSPKVYFTDVGLASYLLGIETVEQMARDPLRGNLVENLVVLELVKARFNKGLDPQLYYFRDVHGHEVDLIFQSANTLTPIEIKAGKTFNKDFLKNVLFFQKLVGERSPTGFVIYAGTQEQKIGSCKILHYSHAVESLQPYGI